MYAQPPKPPWSIKDSCLQTWKITNNIHEVYVWSTRHNFRLMKKPTSFEALTVCNTIEEAFEAATSYLSHCSEQDIH